MVWASARLLDKKGDLFTPNESSGAIQGVFIPCPIFFFLIIGSCCLWSMVYFSITILCWRQCFATCSAFSFCFLSCMMPMQSSSISSYSAEQSNGCCHNVVDKSCSACIRSRFSSYMNASTVFCPSNSSDSWSFVWRPIWCALSTRNSIAHWIGLSFAISYIACQWIVGALK